MKILFLSVTFFAVNFCLSQKSSELSEACKNKIDSTYAALIKEAKVVGASIALVKDGHIIFANGYGFQDKEKDIKADENTVYRIGSCSKSFTAISILQLQEKGILSIDDPIQNYLPQFHPESRFTTTNLIPIECILAHTSGLPSDILNGFFCDDPPSIPWLINRLNNCTMISPVNYYHAYSNVGYGILGELISSQSNLVYKEYLKANIFSPLNMNSTFVDDGTFTSSKMATGYLGKKAIVETQIRDQAAGLIASSVVDMATYLNMLLADGSFNSNQILSENSVAEMERSYTEDITLRQATDWGLGLYSKSIAFADEVDTNFVTLIGHGGDTWAFHADFKYIPEYNIGAVILTNTDKGTEIANAEELIMLYLKEVEGKNYLKYLRQKEDTISRDQKCSPQEVIGEYYLEGIKIDVKNPDKIKFNQGVHKIVLKRQNDDLIYNGKVHIFKFLPFKIKGQQFKFVKLDDKVYLKVIQTKLGTESYQSVKNESGKITESWMAKTGKYVLAEDVFTCTDCPDFFNFQGLTMKLIESKGQLSIILKGKSKGVNGESNLNVISDTICVTPGIGRNSGETLRILENGNLFYNGFEFKKE